MRRIVGSFRSWRAARYHADVSSRVREIEKRGNPTPSRGRDVVASTKRQFARSAWAALVDGDTSNETFARWSGPRGSCAESVNLAYALRDRANCTHTACIHICVCVCVCVHVSDVVHSPVHTACFFSCARAIPVYLVIVALSRAR